MLFLAKLFIDRSREMSLSSEFESWLPSIEMFLSSIKTTNENLFFLFSHLRNFASETTNINFFQSNASCRAIVACSSCG